MLPKSLSSFRRVSLYRYLLLVTLIATATFLCLRANSWLVRAATVTVTNTNDSGPGSLRAAIAAATTGDTINFNLSGCPCTITLFSGELVINKGLTIKGPGPALLTVSGNNTSRVFFINPGAPGTTTPPVSPFPNVSISGLTIANGRAKGGDGGQQDYGGKGGGGGGMGGAIFINGGQVALSQVSFFNNQSAGGNGAAGFGNGTSNGTGGGGAFGNGSSSFGGHVGTPGGNGGNFGGVGGNGGNAAGVAGGNGGDGGGGGGAAENGANGGNGGFGGAGGGGAGSINAPVGGNGGNGGFAGGGGGSGGGATSPPGTTATTPGGAAGAFGGKGGTGIDSGSTGGSGAGGGGAGLGGAVFLRLGSLLIVNTSFTNNTATRGPGGAGFIAATSGSNGQGKGGAIFVLEGASVLMCSNTVFSGNSASDAVGSGTDTNDVYGTIQSTDQCNLSPIANNDSYVMNEGTGISVSDPGVLSNDSDLDGDPLTALLVSGPTHALGFSLRNDGSFFYQPNGNFSGFDSFSYKARDSHNFDSNTATVLLIINPSNDAPTYTPGGNVTVPQGSGAYSATWATDMSPGPPDESGQTLTFFVTGNTNPGLFSSAPAIASNGTLSFTPAANANGTSTITIVLKDDGGTENGGADTSFPFDFTITVAPNNLRINDAKVAEPSSGSINMIFTVTLSAPAPASGVSVDFTTMDEVSSLIHAKAGLDYTTTSGTLTFAPGEQFKTISVPVLSDNLGESNEAFLVLLSNVVNSTLADDMATGTIRILNLPGAVMVSELRTSGPVGLGDEFVEISNNTNSPLTVAASDSSAGYGLFKMGADCNATPVLIGTIPNGTIIPARGHYLFVGSQYSLSDYGGTGAAAGDQTLKADIETDGNVSLFSTADVGNLSSDNRLDAVGFAANSVGNCNLLSEGTVLPSTGFTNLEGSYQRDQCGKLANSAAFGGCAANGLLKDTNSNVADFFWADTAATNTPAGQHLGAPGPENLASPLVRNSLLPALFIDGTQPSTLAPNRVRDLTAITNGALGTMTVRRRYRNDTGGPVTRLRFRIVDISTLPTPAGVADLRALTSSDVSVSTNDPQTCSAFSLVAPCSVPVSGTTVESPPTQALGGGNNTTMSVTLGTPLPAGASINVQWRLGVQTAGSFKFLINVEALP